jgi:4'-phosphopantetheinyl transferase
MLIKPNKTEVFAVQTLSEESYILVKKDLLDQLPQLVTKQIERFKRSMDEQRSLLGEVMSRKLLSLKCGVDVKELNITKSSKGKPELINFPDIHFNISHSGEWVVCAISPAQVGIDVEKIKEPAYRIAERYFSKKELESLNALAGIEKQYYFFDLWTLKESYLKMLGKGLTKSLGSFSIIKNKDQFVLSEHNTLHPKINLKQFELDKGYKLSICSEDNNFASNVQVLKIENLLNTQIYGI